MKKTIYTSIAIIAVAAPLFAGTTMPGTYAVTGIWDAHGALRTIPHRSGSGSPNARDACATQGETYFQVDATAGSNSWACTTTGTPGTWTLQGGGGSSANTRMTIDFPAGGVSGGNVSAGQWNLGGTGASPGYLGSTIPYSNTGGNPSFPATFRLPYNFDKTQSVNVILSGGNTNGVTGTVRFSITIGCSTGGTSSIIAYPSVGTASTITLTQGANTMAEGTATGLNIPSACDSNKMAQLFVARDNTVGGNLADVFGVIDVALTYGTK